MRSRTVTTSTHSYPVHIGVGLLGRLHEVVEMPDGAEKIALFGDDRLLDDADAVGAISKGLEPLGLPIRRFGASGEESKSIARAEWMWRTLATNGFHRNDLVVAFGGGVISDLAGFVAASFHRGMPWVVVPTTLLGMVDASIGGKTGLNLPEGKNLIGAFHPPRAVVADVEILRSLPDDDLRTGLAEVIKHGLIARPDLIPRVATGMELIVARDPSMLEDLVADAAGVKIDIVSADETERGARAFLNYGHTLAHALETLAGYQGITHGKAVALGMMFAAHLAVALGHADLIAEHRAALEGAGLPTAGAGADFDKVLALFARDKKYDAGMRFVVLEDMAKPVVVRDVPERALRDAYEAVR